LCKFSVVSSFTDGSSSPKPGISGIPSAEGVRRGSVAMLVVSICG